MDANFSFKPTVNVVNYEHTRSATSVPLTTQTELPTAKTVNPTGDSADLRNDPAFFNKPTRGEVLLDPGSRQVIYRVVDEASRRVVWQMPDVATLRLRAYARAGGGTSKQPALPNTDVEA